MKSFYIYIEGLSWWLTVFNSLDTNAFKAAQFNEIIVASPLTGDPKMVSRAFTSDTSTVSELQ